MRTNILKLKRHNGKKEIEFELRYLASLSVKERFEMMFAKTKEILNLLEKNGHEGLLKLLKEHKADFIIIGATAFPVQRKI